MSSGTKQPPQMNVLVHQLRNCQRSLGVTRHGTRLLGTQKTAATSSDSLPPMREKSWLTRKVDSSPNAMKIFLKLTTLLGYGSPKQMAGRRAFALYGQVCAVKSDQDRSFWQDGVFALTLPSLYHNYFRMPSSTNLPVLVYHYQPPYLAPHRTTTCTSSTARKVLHPSAG